MGLEESLEEEAPEEGTLEVTKGGTQEGTPEEGITPEEGAIEATVAATGVIITRIMTTLEGIVIMITIGQSKIGAQRAQG